MAWTLFALPPLLISLVYFVTSPKTESMRTRIVASSHGVAIAVVLAVEMVVLGSGHRENVLLYGTAALLLVPALLMYISFELYEGPRLIHLLQAVNLMWLLFLGVLVIMGPAFG